MTSPLEIGMLVRLDNELFEVQSKGVGISYTLRSLETPPCSECDEPKRVSFMEGSLIHENLKPVETIK